jgi:citrate lyase synthetase
LEFSKYIAQNKISSADSIEDAFNMINSGETVIAVGSLYLAGKILQCIPNNAVLCCGKNGTSAKKAKTES